MLCPSLAVVQPGLAHANLPPASVSLGVLPRVGQQPPPPFSLVALSLRPPRSPLKPSKGRPLCPPQVSSERELRPTYNTMRLACPGSRATVTPVHEGGDPRLNPADVAK